MSMSDSDVEMEDDQPNQLKSTNFFGQKVERPERLIPWIEKYRPNTVEEISHQDDVVNALKNCILKANIPHLLFYGPPGTGKTSCIVAAAKQLFGPELYKQRVLELNASDERGIAVIREKVKKFAQYSVGSQKSGEYPCPPFKIIILDEADSMTKDAQAALRRTMENYTKVTRFCIICNYVSRIIEPVTSRCAKFRFQSIGDTAHKQRLSFIAEKEGFGVTKTALEKLVEIADGDLRRSISLMQSAKMLCLPNHPLTETEVAEISESVPAEVVERCLKTVMTGDVSLVQKFVSDLIADGYAINQFLAQLSDAVANAQFFSDNQKAAASRVIALTDERLNDGADEQLQILFTCSQLRQLCHA